MLRATTFRGGRARKGLLPLLISLVACGSPTQTTPEAVPPRWQTRQVTGVEAGMGFRGLGVDVADSGQAVVSVTATGTVWAALAPIGGFGPAQRVDDGDARFARRPTVATTTGGSAMIAWSQTEHGNPQGFPLLVWTSRLLPGGSSWEPASLVEPGKPPPDPLLSGLYPDVAVAPSRACAVVWSSRDILASLSPDGHDWGPAELLEARSDPPRGEAVVEATAAGGFVAAWPSGAFGQVALAEPGSGWGPTTSFGVPAGGLAGQPHLATSRTGRLLAAWNATSSDGRQIVMATEWSEGTGWSPLTLLNEAGTQGYVFGTGLDRAGSGAVFWFDQFPDYGGGPICYVSRLSVGGTWLPPEEIPGPRSNAVAGAVMGDGSLHVVWVDHTAFPDSSVAGTHFDGVGWTEPQTVQDVQTGLATHLAMAANDRGDAVAAWTREADAPGTVWASLWRGSD